MAALTAFCAYALRRAGYRVFPPPPPPEIGSIWTPTRGKSMRRRILDVTDHSVTYGRVPAGPPLPPVSLHAWHVWRQRTRAHGV